MHWLREAINNRTSYLINGFSYKGRYNLIYLELFSGFTTSLLATINHILIINENIYIHILHRTKALTYKLYYFVVFLINLLYLAIYQYEFRYFLINNIAFGAYLKYDVSSSIVYQLNLRNAGFLELLDFLYKSILIAELLIPLL